MPFIWITGDNGFVGQHLARTLVQHGARPDPKNPGVVDRSTIRNNWSTYPILLNA